MKKDRDKQTKDLSNIISIASKILRILATIAIPIIILVMLLVPYIINRLNVVENELIFNGPLSNIVLIESEAGYNMPIDIRYSNNALATISLTDIFNSRAKSTLICFIEVGLLTSVLICLAMCKLLLHLERLFKNIGEKDTPFIDENVKHLRKIVKLMIIVLVLPWITNLIISVILSMRVTFSINLVTIGMILITICLANIFEYGCKLQEKSTERMYGGVDE